MFSYKIKIKKFLTVKRGTKYLKSSTLKSSMFEKTSSLSFFSTGV